MVTNDPRHANVWITEHDPLRVAALADPVIDQLGYDVCSTYVETYWLPILGPSAVWAARRLVDWLGDGNDPVEVPLEPFGRSLGLGGGVARHSPVVRTLARLVDFGMAATGGDTYAVRRRFPPLPARHLQRLPGYLIECHRLNLEAAR